MDAMSVLVPILIAALIVLVIVLVALLVKLMGTLKIANKTISDMKAQLDPTLQHVESITNDLQPAMKKISPLLERVQLTVDAMNLEMMRVDEILEDVSQITDTASSATTAVDNIANAPIKAVSGMAARVRERFGGKDASTESAQLAEQRVAVAQALEDYKNAGEKESKAAAGVKPAAEAEPAMKSDAAHEGYIDIEEKSGE